jgi:hypothetical protein
MPILDAAHFRGSGALQPATLEQLTTVGFGSTLKHTLSRLGWVDRLVAGVGLDLSADGLNVTNSTFWVRGKVTETPASIPAHKLWEGANRSVNLSIAPLNGSDFTFRNGSLCSDYVDADRIRFSFSRAGQPIPPGDWADFGLGNFCLRLVAYLDKTSNAKRGRGPHIKFMVLAFPLSLAQLSELAEATSNVMWPGFKVVEGHCDFFPRASANSWGCPILPILCTRQRDASTTAFPSGDLMRFNIAAIMRTAAVPTSSRSLKDLQKKMRDALACGSAIARTLPTIMWPEVARPDPATGRK